MEKKQRTHVAVVGAGPGGAVMACYLARQGREVDVFEKRPDPRKAGAERGRSINLALSERGLHALAEIGLKEKILAEAIPMRGRMIHAVSGPLSFQPYGTEASEVIYSVSRAGLNMAVVEAAERQPNVRVHFAKRAVGIDLERAILLLQDGGDADAPGAGSFAAAAEAGSRRAPAARVRSEATADFIVGADGAFSAVRRELQRLDRFDYRQDYLEHGYKELTIPAQPGGKWAMEKNALHIWPRGTFMMIALPNYDGSYTATLFWPFEGPNSFAALKAEADILEFFKRTFPDAVPLMPNLPQDFLGNPSSSLVTIRCRPWRHSDKVVLLGDACHAVVPFYGQGMNAALEDCTVLNDCLRRDADRARAFETYESLRKDQADALADLALDNFIEMRDKTASRLFLLRKQAEKILHRLFPAWYVPLYTMVAFTRTPYADAVRRARRQDRALVWIAALLAVLILSALLYLSFVIVVKGTPYLIFAGN